MLNFLVVSWLCGTLLKQLGVCYPTALLVLGDDQPVLTLAIRGIEGDLYAVKTRGCQRV